MKKLPAQSKSTRQIDENVDKWLLRLYIAGKTPKSMSALSNLTRICENYLTNCYEIELIDLLENPHLATEHQIIAIPTLLRISPSPVRKLIGDFSNTERTLTGLDLPNKNTNFH